MSEIFFISDTHFSHKNFLSFTDDLGNKIRPFESVEEMDELMIENWNRVVPVHGAKVYHLGDVSFKAKLFPPIAARLHGKKRLILGNHDDPKDQLVMDHFEKVSIWRIFRDFNFVCTHIPILPDQFRFKVEFNLHGHIHNHTVVDEQGNPDRRYVNMCVEKINYTPVHIDEITQRLKAL